MQESNGHPVHKCKTRQSTSIHGPIQSKRKSDNLNKNI